MRESRVDLAKDSAGILLQARCASLADEANAFGLRIGLRNEPRAWIRFDYAQGDRMTDPGKHEGSGRKIPLCIARTPPRSLLPLSNASFEDVAARDAGNGASSVSGGTGNGKEKQGSRKGSSRSFPVERRNRKARLKRSWMERESSSLSRRDRSSMLRESIDCLYAPRTLVSSRFAKLASVRAFGVALQSELMRR